MAKKLKYPYEQWKQEKERTPSPEQPMELTCYKQEVAGKLCSVSRPGVQTGLRSKGRGE